LAASLAGMGVARAVRRASGPAAGARVLEGPDDTDGSGGGP
ncbi:4-(cytidine 5'-diphospho)-2-C-methyl-D-erythritol kinase, partial [Frankia sp. AiPs1]|nr:4-(cytidine 5'-diphospho)-2-C-methyl-D-erythritol kinase [Frankia sp. AiPs1]